MTIIICTAIIVAAAAIDVLVHLRRPRPVYVSLRTENEVLVGLVRGGECYWYVCPMHSPRRLLAALVDHVADPELSLLHDEAAELLGCAGRAAVNKEDE